MSFNIFKILIAHNRGKWLISNTGISTSKNLTLKTVISNSNLISNGYGPPWGGVGVWGVTADDDRGCYDPV